LRKFKSFIWTKSLFETLLKIPFLVFKNLKRKNLFDWVNFKNCFVKLFSFSLFLKLKNQNNFYMFSFLVLLFTLKNAKQKTCTLFINVTLVIIFDFSSFFITLHFLIKYCCATAIFFIKSYYATAILFWHIYATTIIQYYY
jgi:hypothetical protein